MKVFFVTYDDHGTVEQLGSFGMSVVPRPGEVVTLEERDTASGWVVQQVAHHVGTDYHQVDVTVMPAAEAGIAPGERAEERNLPTDGRIV